MEYMQNNLFQCGIKLLGFGVLNWDTELLSRMLLTSTLCLSDHYHESTAHTHMGHFPQDGENEQNLSEFFFFEASL